MNCKQTFETVAKSSEPQYKPTPYHHQRLVARQRPEGDTLCTRDLSYLPKKDCMIQAHICMDSGEHTW